MEVISLNGSHVIITIEAQGAAGLEGSSLPEACPEYRVGVLLIPTKERIVLMRPKPKPLL